MNIAKPSSSIESKKSISLREMVKHGVFWSVVQTSGNRLITFFLAILLARILSPEEFGIAAATMLVLMLIPIIAEMGFNDSILQRRDLQSEDVNLPFICAIIVAIILFSTVLIWRIPLAEAIGLGERSGFLIAMAGTVLLSVPTAFQEAMYKRNVQFRALALRAFVANISSGLVALAVALSDFGIWTFVVQAWVALTINVIWIWSRPQWLPSWQRNWKAFREMLRFSLPVLTQRLVDFAGTRTLDIVIISQIGMAAYGLYVLGYRLYQTMIQLLQSTLFDISLVVLSKIAHERERIAQTYLETIGLSARFMAPFFVMVAAVAPEVSFVLFGQQWNGVEMVVTPLLLMGSVHCVQYLNGSFLSARGRPELVLVTGVAKGLLQIAAVLLIGSTNVYALTWAFVAANLVAAPISFFMVARELGVSAVQIISRLALPAALAATSFGSVVFLRPMISGTFVGVFVEGFFLASLFALLYLGLGLIFDPAFRGLVAAIYQKRRKLPTPPSP